MIRLDARYGLGTRDVALVDDLSDSLCNALVSMNPDVEADVAVSIPERVFEVSLTVPQTSDVFEAYTRGMPLLAEAFEKAGLRIAPADAPLVPPVQVKAEFIAA